jgi:hypothetical protein
VERQLPEWVVEGKAGVWLRERLIIFQRSGGRAAGQACGVTTREWAGGTQGKWKGQAVIYQHAHDQGLHLLGLYLSSVKWRH